MFALRLLRADDDLSEFDCGTEALTTWLTANARRAHDQGIVRVYVWVDESQPTRVLGYSALQPTQVLAADLTRSQSGGHTTVPGYLIARLALDTALHGQGLGSELLVRSLEVCVRAADVGGGRIIVVDPIDDAARDFYLRHDFHPSGGDHRLAMKVATARSALGG